MTKHCLVRSFIALVLLVAACAVSFHFHQREETGGVGETCAVCVAGHQLKSGAATTLDRAEAPLLQVFGSVRFLPAAPETLILPLHSSRAPPIA